MTSIIDRTIGEALAASRASYQARGIRVLADLRASASLATHDPVVQGAFATLFRALPDRLVPGSVLDVRTLDRAGGDVEVEVEAEWLARADRRHSDLVELALAGLEEICRARSGRVELEARPDGSGPRRRLLFLVPSLERAPGWHPLRRS